MKIKPEHIAHMRAAIGVTLATSGKTLEQCRDYLRQDSRVKDLEKRLRWDLLFAAGLTPWLCANLYPYADDTHIDTALRHIVSKLEEA